MKIDRSNFSSMQLPWKMAQQRKKIVKWMTLPMHVSTQVINSWTNAIFPPVKEKK